MVHYVVAHCAKAHFSMVHCVVAVNNWVFRGAVLTVVATAEAHLDSDLGGHNLVFHYVADARKYAVVAHHFDVAGARKYAVVASHLFLAGGHKYVLVGQPVA